jgi:hypothetical protein
MDRRDIQTMGNGCLHENLGDNGARANSFAISKNVIDVGCISFHSDTSTNTLWLLVGRLRIMFIEH